MYPTEKMGENGMPVERDREGGQACLGSNASPVVGSLSGVDWLSLLGVEWLFHLSGQLAVHSQGVDWLSLSGVDWMFIAI